MGVGAGPVSLRRADSKTLGSVPVQNERSKPNLHGVMIDMHVLAEAYGVGPWMAAEQPREIRSVAHKSAAWVPPSDHVRSGGSPRPLGISGVERHAEMRPEDGAAEHG